MIANKYLGNLTVQDEDCGFTDTTVPFLKYPIAHIYISDETMIDEAALEQFNSFLNELEMYINEGFKALSETDDSDVKDYFNFYLEEIPEVSVVDNPQNLSQSEMTDCLKVHAVASHGNGEHQFFVIYYTLGFDQLLALKFDKSGLIQIAWES